ncbi:hypothetical protein GQ43DRAFT_231734 [Delitschia confertaspora ATCC 74209]|uniref:Uncharacterized protein n=1 Tax=Delitschia confertaspora ATCC 74209 TaxID=1513339 RepID=A0A9P4JRH1_9PLEO|nr:hypothetical protein GQ43DRAFT_231734 [Delitschia confertaspora ATCC 74209]
MLLSCSLANLLEDSSIARLPFQHRLASVQGGCCAFYNGTNCDADGFFLTIKDREYEDIKERHRNSISSWWCTFKPGCQETPGVQ